MDKSQLVSYLERMDAALHDDAVIYIYGSGAFILLDEPGRTSLDIDIAAPYCHVNERDFREAAALACLPVNPEYDSADDHIEWISALRLCLPKPADDSDIILWQGKHLIVKTVSIPALIASKLVRYDAGDRADVQYILTQHPVDYAKIEAGARLLPSPFNQDAVVLENLKNLKDDMLIWGASHDGT